RQSAVRDDHRRDRRRRDRVRLQRRRGADDPQARLRLVLEGRLLPEHRRQERQASRAPVELRRGRALRPADRPAVTAPRERGTPVKRTLAVAAAAATGLVLFAAPALAQEGETAPPANENCQPVDPTEPPVQPTAPPLQPTAPPVQPTEPTKPTE